MDEYQLEIQQLRRALGRLKAGKAAEALIDEYEAELRNLVALYQAATDTFEQASERPDLRAALADRGFGDWTLQNVYSFVYESSLDAEFDGRDLANAITHTDYTSLLTRTGTL